MFRPIKFFNKGKLFLSAVWKYFPYKANNQEKAKDGNKPVCDNATK